MFVFVSIISNLFDIKTDDFCLLKLWIYDLLLINKKQRSAKKQRMFYCLSLSTLAVDSNVETLKENGILLLQFAQKVVKARFLRNVTGWD